MSFGKGECSHARIQAGPGETQSISVLAARLVQKHPAMEKQVFFHTSSDHFVLVELQVNKSCQHRLYEYAFPQEHPC